MHHDGAFASLLGSLLLSHEQHQQRGQLLEHVRQVFKGFYDHEDLLDEALRYHRYVLEISATLTTTGSLVVYLFNDQICRQHAINAGELYHLELDHSPNFKLNFALKKLNGQSTSVNIRSSSLLKRVMSLERREQAIVDVNELPMDVHVKKSLSLKGHTHSVTLRLTREMHGERVPRPTFEFFLQLIRTLHEHDAQTSSEAYDGYLSESSFALLHSFTQFFAVPSAAVKATMLSVFLVWEPTLNQITDEATRRLVTDLAHCEIDATHDLLEEAVQLFYECIDSSVEECLNAFAHEMFFPPDGHIMIRRLNSSLKLLVDMCVLPLWDEFPNLDSSTRLTGQLEALLRNSVNQWASSTLDNILDLHDLCLVVFEAWASLRDNYHAHNLFFHQFNLNYLQIVLEEIDEKLELQTKKYLQQRVEHLDSRNVRQLEDFTRSSMKLFDTFKCITEFVHSHKLHLQHIPEYETWFAHIVPYWTTSWKLESLNMVEKTLSVQESDNSDRRPLPVALYSFLCVQKGLSDDFLRLSFQKEENVLAATMRLLDILCNNVKAYTQKLFEEAKRTSNKIVVLAKAANGIEQADLFLEESWQRFAGWKRLGNSLPENEVTAANRMAKQLVVGTTHMCEKLMSALATLVCRIKKDELAKIARQIVQDENEYISTLRSYMRIPSTAERVHSIARCVDQLFEQIHMLLLPRCAKLAEIQLTLQLERLIQLNLKQNQTHLYYNNIYLIVKLVYQSLGRLQPSPLLSMLHQHSFSTKELILSYYAHITDKFDTASRTATGVPCLHIQTAYVNATGDNVLLIVNVLHLSSSLVFDSLCERVDVFVSMQLMPLLLYPQPSFAIQCTRRISQTLQPNWKQQFQFLIPHQTFFTHGSTLSLSVYDKARKCDRLLGRILISTSKILSMESPSIKKMPPPYAFPLQAPVVDHESQFYQILKSRANLDSDAKRFIGFEKRDKAMYFNICTLASSFRPRRRVSKILHKE